MMERDTDIGGPGGRFPVTRHSAILATRSEDAVERTRGFETLVASYWKPAYKYVRIKWKADNEEAKDLTQGFFVRAMEKSWFQRFDPTKASFRTYLRTCLDGYVSNERKAARRLKRSGDAPLLSLDFETAEGELRRIDVPAEDGDPDAFFHQEWVRSLFAMAVTSLRESCEEKGKTVHFALFEKYDLDGTDGTHRPTYDELAAEYDLPTTQITNFLAWVRREFRRIVLERLREVTGSDEEFRSEARALLGHDPQ